MKIIYSVFILILISMLGWAQISITTLGTSISQNFDGMGGNAAETLPTGFKFSINWSTGTTLTTIAAGTSGTGTLSGTSSGGFYNFANGVTATSTDRALGILTSGSFLSLRTIF